MGEGNIDAGKLEQLYNTKCLVRVDLVIFLDDLRHGRNFWDEEGELYLENIDILNLEEYIFLDFLWQAQDDVPLDIGEVKSWGRGGWFSRSHIDIDC